MYLYWPLSSQESLPSGGKVWGCRWPHNHRGCMRVGMLLFPFSIGVQCSKISGKRDLGILWMRELFCESGLDFFVCFVFTTDTFSFQPLMRLLHKILLIWTPFICFLLVHFVISNVIDIGNDLSNSAFAVKDDWTFSFLYACFLRLYKSLFSISISNKSWIFHLQ